MELRSLKLRDFRSYGSAEAAGAPARGTLAEAMDALLVLGYTRAEAQNVLKTIDTQALSIEDIIKEALKKLMKN